MREVFHKGEKAVQKITGGWIFAEQIQGMISDQIDIRSARYIAKQQMAVVSSLDNDHHVWASVLFGEAGFVGATATNKIAFDLNKLQSSKDDIFFKNIESNTPVATMFIDLATRRRFRINGHAQRNGDSVEIQIREAYPNCPKFITQRDITTSEIVQENLPKSTTGSELTPFVKDWITGADTFFIASQSNDERLDISHRGGNPGFIEFTSEDTIQIPDYSGNNLYMTLGNLHENPDAGLLFLDFENQRVLQLIGKAELLLEQKTEADLEKSGGTGRFFTFTIEKFMVTENHNAVHWQFGEYSPFNP